MKEDEYNNLIILFYLLLTISASRFHPIVWSALSSIINYSIGEDNLCGIMSFYTLVNVCSF